MVLPVKHVSDNGCDHALNNHDHLDSCEACDAEQVNTRTLNIIKNYNLTSLIMHSQCGMHAGHFNSLVGIAAIYKRVYFSIKFEANHACTLVKRG